MKTGTGELYFCYLLTFALLLFCQAGRALPDFVWSELPATYVADRAWLVKSQLTTNNLTPRRIRLTRQQQLSAASANPPPEFDQIIHHLSPGRKAGLPHPPQLLKLLWEIDKSPASVELCFNGTADSLLLSEVLARGAVIVNSCQQVPYLLSQGEDQVLCQLQLNTPSEKALLEVFGGRFNPGCSQGKVIDDGELEVSGRLAAVSYPLVTNTHDSVLKSNHTLPRHTHRKGSELFATTGHYSSPYDHFGKRPPRMVLPDAKMFIVLPGLLLPDESFFETNTPDLPLHYAVDPGQNTVVVQLNLDGDVQSLSLSLEQWQLLVKHGIHLSPPLLQFFVRYLSSKWQTFESLQMELNDLLDQQTLDPLHQSGHGEISQLLDKIESLPPEHISLETTLQTLYELTLRAATGWQPIADNSTGSAYHSLDSLRSALDRLELLNRTYSALRAISEEGMITAGTGSYDNQTLEQFLEQIKQNTGELQALLLKRSLAMVLASLPGQDPITEEVPGVISLPDHSRATGENERQQDHLQEAPQNHPIEEQDPSTGQGALSSTAAGNQPPPGGATNAPVPVRRRPLREIVNEKLYERSKDEQVIEILRHSATLSLDSSDLLAAMMRHLDTDLQSSLQAFLGNLRTYGNDDASWADLEQPGLLSKGLVLSILWAQGLPQSHPFIKAIMGSVLIYKALDSGGFKGIWQLLDDRANFDTSLFDVIEYTARSTSNPILRDYLQLEQPLSPLHVQHVYDVLLNPLISRQVLDLQLPGVGQSLENPALPSHHDIGAASATLQEQQSLEQPPAEYGYELHDPGWLINASDMELIDHLRAVLPSSPDFRDLAVIRVLGRGAYGIVFEVSRGAEHYALKYVPIKDDSHLKSLQQSIKAIGLLSAVSSDFHNVIISHELDLAHNRYIQLMKLMETTFDKAIGPKGMPPAELYQQWFGPIVKQLLALHELGFCHRDLKPSNIGRKGQQVLIIDLDTLYCSGPKSGDSGRGAIVGTPEFAATALLRQIIPGEEVPKVEPFKQDYAGLVHTWLFGRLGQALFSVYWNNLVQIDDYLYRVYFSGQLTQPDRARLSLSMVETLRDKPEVFSQLFTLANKELTPVDKDIAWLLLNKNVSMRDLKPLAQKLEQSWPAQPEQGKPETTTHSLPTLLSAIKLHDKNPLSGPSSAHSLGQTSAGIERYSSSPPTHHTALVHYGQKQLGAAETRQIVSVWRKHPAARLYLYNKAYILTLEPLSEGRNITFSEFVVHTQRHWAEPEQQREELELGYSVPLRISDGRGQAVPNPQAREILRHMGLEQRLAQLFKEFIWQEKMHRGRQSQWERFAPELSLELEHSGQSFYQAIYLRYSARLAPAGTFSLHRQWQDLRQLVLLAAELLTTIQSPDPGDTIPATYLPLLKDIKDTLNGPDPEQFERQVSTIIPMNLSPYGRYLFQQQELVQQWLSWQQVIRTLEQLASISTTFQGHQEFVDVVAYYKQQFEALRPGFNALGRQAEENDSLLTATMPKKRIAEEMNQVPNLKNLADLLRKSGVFQQVLSLLSSQSDLHVEPLSIEDHLQRLNNLGRLKKGYVLLALETFGAGQYYYQLANSDHYARDAALAKPLPDLIEMLEPPANLRPELELATLSHELLQQKISTHEIINWLNREKHQPSFALRQQAHPFTILRQWRLDSLSRNHGNQTPGHFAYQLTRLRMDMKNLARPRPTEPTQVLPVPCPDCREPMQRVTALSLVQAYHNNEIQLSGAVCDACRKHIFLGSYSSSRFHVSQTNMFHCNCNNGMDLCDECVSKPVRCPATGCGREMKPVTARNTGYNDGSEIFCDNCADTFSFIHNQQLTDVNTVWHCDSPPGHDLCQSCVLRQRGYPATVNCPDHFSDKTLTRWSPGWHPCMKCGNELQPGEIVAECPVHYQNINGVHFSNYAHPQCLKGTHQ